MIYSLYIFDRHCDCVYYQDWNRTSPVRPPPPSNFKAGIHRLPPPPDPTGAIRESIFSNQRSSIQSGAVDGQDGRGQAGPVGRTGKGIGGLPFDEEAKLVYGVVLSLRNMAKKLSGREDLFTSYRTPTYKFHLFETPTNYRFVLLSDPSGDSLSFVLRKLYTGAFMEYVVRNPLIDMNSRDIGIDSDAFRSAVDRQMRGLSMFNT
ncbi:Sybindin-like protein [Dioszegia hungarica]|uniref:Trafficking protein particle complex subunit n=1 Tax=Dioszegia hungarica TaxID=4972 RepID=A0AA38LTC6_9TREE|nr:Sybindin-like protein [Dioszegia hungarica]KAI9632461.1 Sybindin-like protein [Dioszegia hungarica]